MHVVAHERVVGAPQTLNRLIEAVCQIAILAQVAAYVFGLAQTFAQFGAELAAVIPLGRAAAPVGSIALPVGRLLVAAALSIGLLPLLPLLPLLSLLSLLTLFLFLLSLLSLLLPLLFLLSLLLSSLSLLPLLSLLTLLSLPSLSILVGLITLLLLIARLVTVAQLSAHRFKVVGELAGSFQGVLGFSAGAFALRVLLGLGRFCLGLSGFWLVHLLAFCCAVVCVLF